MQMLTEVIHQKDESEFEYHKDEFGQIIKSQKKPKQKIITIDKKGTKVQNEIIS